MSKLSFGQKAGITASIATTILSTVFGGVGGYTYVRRQNLLREIPTHPSMTDADRLRLGTMLDETAARTLREPESMRQIVRLTGQAHPTEAQTLDAARSLGARGASALSAASLDLHASLRVHLAQISPAVCASLWNGRTDKAEVFAAIARLPDAEARQYFVVSEEAMRAALRPGFTIPTVDSALIESTFVRAGQTLEGDEQARFQRTLAAGTNANDADGCAAILTLYRSAATLDAPTRERFYRSLNASVAQ